MKTVENLTNKFGDVTAVEGISFQVKEGEVFGFLGPNGAGKTTTVRMLCCLISKTSGSASIDRYQIGKADDSLQIRKMIGLVPDNVAAKDIRVFLRKKYTIYSLVVFPIIIGIGLPFVLNFVISRQGALLRTQHLTDLMNAFAFFFAIGASLIPTLLASYSLVGEKVEKSLEPLLEAPITNRELLLGKGIGAFIPSIGSLYIGSLFFIILADLLTHSALGYYYFPNWTIGMLLLILMPLLSILSVEWSVIVSARATDPRAAQLQGILIAIPLFFIYVATEVGAIKLSMTAIWIISGAAFIADIILFFLSTRTF